MSWFGQADTSGACPQGPNPAPIYSNSPQAVALQIEAISEAANCGDVDWFGATCTAPVFTDGASSGLTTCAGQGHRQSSGQDLFWSGDVVWSCPASTAYSTLYGDCVPAGAIDPGNNGFCDCPLANPINPGTGNKFQKEQDYRAQGDMPLEFWRQYNSAGTSFVTTAWMGVNWRTNLDRAIVARTRGADTIAEAQRPDGKVFYFTLVGGNYVAKADVSDRLTRIVDGGGQTTGYTYVTAASEETETYDANGRLVSIANRAGLTQTIESTRVS